MTAPGRRGCWTCSRDARNRCSGGRSTPTVRPATSGASWTTRDALQLSSGGSQGGVMGFLRLHGGCKSERNAGPTRVFHLVRPASKGGSPDWTRTGTATKRSWASCSTSPEWLSQQQAAIVYGVSVDLRRRNHPRPGSRLSGRLIRVRVRVRVDDLDRSSRRSLRDVHRFVRSGEGSWLRHFGTRRAR